MSYTPTEWKTGDVITAEKLNNMESGIAGGSSVFAIEIIGNDTQLRLSMTFGEIKALIQNGKVPLLFAHGTHNTDITYSYFLVKDIVYGGDDGGDVIVDLGSGQQGFECDSDDEYPTLYISG